MALIFLPGSGCSSNVWNNQLDFFDGSIALNFPGHPDGDLIDSVVGLVDWLVDILDQHAEKSVVLVGHSFGSAVALQVAINSHPAIKGLVLIGSGSRLKVMPMILDNLAKLVATKSDVPEMMLSANKGIQEPLRSEIDDAIKVNGVSALLNDFKACNEFDVSEYLSTIKVPTHIIVGEKDVMTPLKYAEYLNANIQTSTLSIVPSGSHMVFAEQSNEVNIIIKSFLDSL